MTLSDAACLLTVRPDGRPGYRADFSRLDDRRKPSKHKMLLIS
jgi:hypothetical protein